VENWELSHHRYYTQDVLDPKEPTKLVR